jgi:hypothetical protein
MPGIYRCTKDYHSPYPDSILFFKGERVRIGEEYDGDPDWKDWVRCQTANGNEAWIPKSYLKIDGNEGSLLQDYDARELSVTIGEILEVTEIVNGFGLAEKKDGQHGWVPMNHLETYPENES